MSTSNFHSVNASKIFACEIEEEWDYQDLKGNIISELKSGPYYFREGGRDTNELRSFPSNVLGRISKEHEYKDFAVEVTVSAIIRSGYYEGCNLDWNIEYNIAGGDNIDPDYFAQELEYQKDWTANKAKRYEKQAQKRAEKLKNELVEYLEKIYQQYSTPLVVTARFSNGETWYEKSN